MATARTTASATERAWMECLFDDLWPLHRSITGAGLRDSLDRIGTEIPLERLSFPTGQSVLDWTIPKEWVVRDWRLTAPDGTTVVDRNSGTLSLVNYSVPYRGTVSRQELESHLFSNPDVPDAVPYVTSYYQPRWGFCLKHTDRQALADGDYRVEIDTELVDGSLDMGEAVLDPTDARTDSPEILISTHLCHPSMANDQLSGPIASAALYRRLAQRPDRRFRYRFVYLPETIGSIAYLSVKGDELRAKLAAGYVCVLAGGSGPFTYRRSRRDDSLADRAAARILADMQSETQNAAPLEPPPAFARFNPAYGNDQRQYCSPGFNLPVGCLTHTSDRKTREYHSSLDNKEALSFDAIQRTVDVYERIVDLLETNRRYRNLYPFGEPFLSRHGLYDTLNHRAGKPGDAKRFREAVMWLLNWSDGDHDLLAIAEKSDLPYDSLRDAAEAAVKAGLLDPLSP